MCEYHPAIYKYIIAKIVPMELQRVLERILYFVVMPFVAISFVLTTLTNDTRIFIAAEAIADTYYPLPYGWDAAYEVKPIGNRILNWVLYKVADTFVPFVSNNYFWFGVAVKITVLVVLLLCCWYISKKIPFKYSFALVFLAMACQATFGIMMSEWFSVLFALVAIGMCFEEDKRWMYAAGVLCLCIALLKSITVLMIIPIICAVYLIGGNIDWKKFIAGYIVAGLAFLAMCLTIWPYSIGDMLMSRYVAHVGRYDLMTLFKWFWITQDVSNIGSVLIRYMPIIAIGICIAVVVIARYYHRKEAVSAGLFLLMWAVPIGIVLIQSEFIVYHYLLMALPAIITIALFARFYKKSWLKTAWVVFAAILTTYLIINSVFGVFTQYEYTFWHQKELNADTINSQFDIIGQESVLYLDPGDAPYYFHANSSCHYLTPMPVERSTDKWNMSHLHQFKECYDCIVSYQGEYIIADINNGNNPGFFGRGLLQQERIMEMIRNNYTEVESLSWTIYKRNDLLVLQ